MMFGSLENRQRLAEFAPTREKLFKSPDEAPGCYFKRFSKDGRFVFAFGGESRFLIHPVTYKGKIGNESENQSGDDKNIDVNVDFGMFLKDEAIEIDVLSGLRGIPSCPELACSLLCRDFCLDLQRDDKRRFLILAGSSPADRYEVDDRPPKTFIFRPDGTARFIENDSHTAFPSLDHVTFFMVDLNDGGKVVDYLHFRYDFIYLAHHLGVGLDEASGTFSILSMKNQRIFLFKTDSGKFEALEELARNSVSTEESFKVVKPAVEQAERDASWGRPGISGLVMKMYRFLIEERGGFEDVPSPASILASLHVWKHQLMSSERILMRWCASNLILSTNPRHQSMVHALDPLPPLNKMSFLAVYNLQSGEFEIVANSADGRLLEWMRSNWRDLRGKSGDLDSFEVSLVCLKRREGDVSFNWDAFGLDGCSNALVRRFTNLIPQSPQQLVDSVWLDSRAFRWDSKASSLLSRSAPISCTIFERTDAASSNNGSGLLDGNYGPERVKFFARGRSNSFSHSLRFVDEDDFSSSRIEGDASNNNNNNLDRHRWVNVLFHPTLPLILVYQYGIFRSISIRVFFR